MSAKHNSRSRSAIMQNTFHRCSHACKATILQMIKLTSGSLRQQSSRRVPHASAVRAFHDRIPPRFHSWPSGSVTFVFIFLVLDSFTDFVFMFPVADKTKTPLGYGGHSARLPFKVIRVAVRDGLAAPPERPPHQGQSERFAGGLASDGRSTGKASPLQGHALPRPLGKVRVCVESLFF